MQIQVIGPELIYGRLYDKIGYSGINNEMFRHLVICRLFNPGSKLRTVEYLRQYLNKDYDVKAIYKIPTELQNAQQPSHKICNFTNGQQAKGII